MNLNATLFAQLVVFLILAWFTMKFVWPPIMLALDERVKKIADGLAAAERSKNDMELAKKYSADALQEGRTKTAAMLAQADKRAAQMIDEAKSAAKVEYDRIVASARAEIEQETVRAKEALRDQVASLAVAGAERILRREIDQKSHHDMLSNLGREL